MLLQLAGKAFQMDLEEPIFYRCDSCDGSGWEHHENEPVRLNKYGFPIIPANFKCKKCNGTGKLSWLEILFGK